MGSHQTAGLATKQRRAELLTLLLTVSNPILWLFVSALPAISAAAATPRSSIVTHELTPAQLQEDFHRLRFSLEHADPGLYRYTPKAEMDSRFDAVGRQLQQPLTDLEFYRLLAPLIAAVRNSHTSIRPPADALSSIRSFDNVFPFVLRYRDGRAYIEANLSADTSIRPGTEIVSINGRSMADVTKELFDNITVEGFADEAKYGFLDRSFWEDLLLYNGPVSSYTLVLRDPGTGGARKHVVLGVSATKVAGRTQATPPETGPVLSLTVDHENSVAVMRLRNFIEPDTDDFFRRSFQELATSKVRNLIIDLRGNHGGVDWYNSDLISYLADRPFRFYRARTLSANSYEDLRYLTYDLDDFLFPEQIAALPADVREHPLQHWTLHQLVDLSLATDRAGGVQSPKTEDHFSGAVYVLVDHMSASSSAEVPAMLQHLGLATVVGEEPDGSYQGETAGIIPTLTLPNSKLVIHVPLLEYQNDVMPGIRIGRGVEPTFRVSETLEDSLAGTDTAITFTRGLIRARLSGQVPEDIIHSKNSELPTIPRSSERLSGEIPGIMVSAPQSRIRVSPVRAENAGELTELLNAIILQGGSTAYEQPFTAEQLDYAMLSGPDVVHCVVAQKEHSVSLCGFQTLYRSAMLPQGILDIATFTRFGVARCGIGSALFAVTSQFARDNGFIAINATIRADNVSGLAYYAKLGFADHHVERGVPLMTGQPVDRISKRFRLPRAQISSNARPSD